MNKKEIRELLHGDPYVNLFKLLIKEVSLSEKGGELTFEQEEIISALFRGDHKILKYKRNSGCTTAIKLFLAANFLFKKYKNVTLVTTKNIDSIVFDISDFLNQMGVLKGDVIKWTPSVCAISMDDIRTKILIEGTLSYETIKKDDLVIFDNIDNCDKGSGLITPNFGVVIYTSDIMSCEDHYKKVLDKVIKICREDRIDYKELANYISGLEDIVIDIRDIKQEYDFF